MLGIDYRVIDEKRCIVEFIGYQAKSAKAVCIEDDACEVSSFVNGPSAIKPKSANYGDGITLFEKTPSISDVKYALKHALKYDDTVLIEEFIRGEEYRFFLIDGRVRSVVKRVPANVTGDGKHTIKELIAIKSGFLSIKFSNSMR